MTRHQIHGFRRARCVLQAGCVENGTDLDAAMLFINPHQRGIANGMFRELVFNGKTQRIRGLLFGKKILHELIFGRKRTIKQITPDLLVLSPM